MANLKKIILVITNSRGANQAFVTNDFQHLLLEDIIALVKQGILAGVHLVEGENAAYIRSSNNSAKEDNLDSLSISASSLSKQIKEPEENEEVSLYVEAYGKFLESRFEHDELLYLGGTARIPRRLAREMMD